jgi:fatty acid desaturase
MAVWNLTNLGVRVLTWIKPFGNVKQGYGDKPMEYDGARTLNIMLQTIAFQWLGLSEPLGTRFMRALRVARFSRAVSVRHHLGLAALRMPTAFGSAYVDLDALMCQTLRPQVLVQCVHDLVLERVLTEEDGRAIEAALLRVINAKGEWKP